ncbi:hypothetical protein [Gordonia rubripertincta]|uniref:Lipoprotein n=1 Tax=Gordonia rubripertincta TaxID=36822 RepID=A0ABT4MPS2_GORRU|nr:hypothetical protein [Gordonia rubripertincta]MCZ4548983.1 hypothetical protein [Gordonia rubripertincta]
MNWKWVGAAAVCGLLFTGCATTIDGSSTVDAGQVSAYQSDVSVTAEQSRIAESSRAAQAARTITLALCSQFTTTVVTMLNSYNQFVTKLNEVQSYSATDGGGQVVIDQLTAGEQAISAKLVPGVEAPVEALVRAFLTRNTELIAAVRGELRSGLNDPADRWIDARNKAVQACGKLAP